MPPRATSRPKTAPASPVKQSAPPQDAREAASEEVDGVAVLAEVRPLPVRRPGRSPVMAQAAAVAATGFVAGAATAAVLHRRRSRRALPIRRRASGSELLSVVGSRSFLVDVHLLGGRD